jgi:hypothetical protein
MFDVDEELERRGFSSVADLADHIREHGGRYVAPEFDLSGAASLQDIERMERRRDDLDENFAAVSEVNAAGELTVDPDLIRRFTDRGWEIDGEGRDQIVMSRPGARTVLKIVGQGTDTHTAEIRRAVRFFRDHQHNPHFPRVGLDRTLDWKGQKYYAYTQERLMPLSGDEEILDYLEYAMGEIGHGEDPDYSQAPPGLAVEQVDGLVSAIYDMFDEGMLTQTNFDLGNVANIMQRANGQLVIVDPVSFDQDLAENFADGKKPGRKGLSRRVGIPQKATLGQLEKIARSSTGERRRMAQWQLNMRRGRARKAK